MPCCRAVFVTGKNLSKDSAIEQLIFFCENDSEAAAKTATSVAPAARAASNPLRFGVSTGYETPGLRRMRSRTSVWSAICGTHLGDTKAVASTAGRPASARRSISSSFTAVGTSPGSFCRPSRGPTSTMRTRLFKRHQLRALEHLLTRAVVDLLHYAVGRRGDGVLHLHRFQDQQRVPLGHLGAGLGQQLDDFPRHGRGEGAGGSVFFVGSNAGERKPARVAIEKHVPGVALAHGARLECAAIQTQQQRSVREGLAFQGVFAAVYDKAQARLQEA